MRGKLHGFILLPLLPWRSPRLLGDSPDELAVGEGRASLPWVLLTSGIFPRFYANNSFNLNSHPMK